MNFRFKLKEKHKRLLVICGVALVLFLSARGIRQWLVVKDMTAEEKTIYYEQKQEEKQGYRCMSSHQLTEEEAVLRDLFQYLKAGNTIEACKIMDVPDAFDTETYNQWLKSTGIQPLFAYDLSEIGILDRQEEREETVNYKSVTYDEHAYYIFFTGDNTVRCRFVYQPEDEVMRFVPDSGIIENYELESPSKNLYEYSANVEEDEDLEQYLVTTIEQPYLSEEKWSTTWYKFEFPRFLNCTPHFLIASELGTFETEYVEQESSTSSSAEPYHTVLAIIPDETVNEILDQANNSLKNIYTLLQAQASDAELGKYLLSGNILETCSQSTRNYDEIYEKLQTVTDCNLYYNKEASGTLPVEYNCRLAENDGVIVKVNASVNTTLGECRKVTTLHLRYMDDTWKIVDMDTTNANNLFVDISTFDPQW